MSNLDKFLERARAVGEEIDADIKHNHRLSFVPLLGIGVMVVVSIFDLSEIMWTFGFVWFLVTTIYAHTHDMKLSKKMGWFGGVAETLGAIGEDIKKHTDHATDQQQA
jgi:hypothetical protein